jgi:REP-associated tyrosine transposase
MFTRRPEHPKTFSYTGFHRYFLTFCTDRRARVFVADLPVKLVFVQLVRTATQEQFAILAYCFMPDHLHLLVEGRSEQSDCRQFISRFKQLSGFYYNKEFNSRLWQRYGYEHTLRDDEATISVAKYLLQNPVRAGMVSTLRQCPYLGSLEYDVADLMEGIFS